MISYRLEKTTTPSLISKYPVCSFGCVDVNGVKRQTVNVRNSAKDAMTIFIQVRDEQGVGMSSVFSLLSSSVVPLHPGEETTLLLCFQPTSVDEFIGTLLITPVYTQQEKGEEEEVLAMTMVGYGGMAVAEMKETEHGLAIANRGNRTMALFALTMNE